MKPELSNGLEYCDPEYQSAREYMAQSGAKLLYIRGYGGLEKTSREYLEDDELLIEARDRWSQRLERVVKITDKPWGKVFRSSIAEILGRNVSITGIYATANSARVDVRFGEEIMGIEDYEPVDQWTYDLESGLMVSNTLYLSMKSGEVALPYIPVKDYLNGLKAPNSFTHKSLPPKAVYALGGLFQYIDERFVVRLISK